MNEMHEIDAMERDIDECGSKQEETETKEVVEESKAKRTTPNYYIANVIEEFSSKKELKKHLSTLDKEALEGLSIIKGKEVGYRPVERVEYDIDD